MAILTRELRHKARGPRLQEQDWWHLCYDTDTREFFVEHRWHHRNPDKLNGPADLGRDCVGMEMYRTRNSRKVEQAKAELLAEAGHEA